MGSTNIDSFVGVSHVCLMMIVFSATKIHAVQEKFVMKPVQQHHQQQSHQEAVMSSGLTQANNNGVSSSSINVTLGVMGNNKDASSSRKSPGFNNNNNNNKYAGQQEAMIIRAAADQDNYGNSNRMMSSSSSSAAAAKVVNNFAGNSGQLPSGGVVIGFGSGSSSSFLSNGAKGASAQQQGSESSAPSGSPQLAVQPQDQQQPINNHNNKWVSTETSEEAFNNRLPLRQASSPSSLPPSFDGGRPAPVIGITKEMSQQQQQQHSSARHISAPTGPTNNMVEYLRTVFEKLSAVSSSSSSTTTTTTTTATTSSVTGVTTMPISNSDSASATVTFNGNRIVTSDFELWQLDGVCPEHSKYLNAATGINKRDQDNVHDQAMSIGRMIDLILKDSLHSYAVERCDFINQTFEEWEASEPDDTCVPSPELSTMPNKCTDSCETNGYQSSEVLKDSFLKVQVYTLTQRVTHDILFGLPSAPNNELSIKLREMTCRMMMMRNTIRDVLLTELNFLIPNASSVPYDDEEIRAQCNIVDPCMKTMSLFLTTKRFIRNLVDLWA